MNFLNPEVNSASNFELKRDYADLRARSGATAVGLTALEAMRIKGASLTASKHGLEVICGASCETGAQ